MITAPRKPPNKPHHLSTWTTLPPKSCRTKISFLPPLFLSFLTLILLSLSGCNIYNSNFECPAKKGIGCVSASEVLDMIVEGEDDAHRADPRRKELFPQEENTFVPPNPKGDNPCSCTTQRDKPCNCREENTSTSKGK